MTTTITRTHPTWCQGKSANVNCGDHLSDPVETPATAGHNPGTASIAAEQRADGTRGVCLELRDNAGRWVEVSFTPAELRRFLVAQLNALDLAEEAR